FDAAGNLYGTTAGGGTHGGYGAVFKLIPEAGGGWSEKVLHSFGSGSDGRYRPSSVILDAAGNLYGTTAGGGTDNVGIVFELTPTTSGPWDETILHDFLNNDEDGVDPIGGLIFDAAGNLYGTTTAGGIHGAGTLFEMTPTTGGSWTEQVLYVFKSENTYSGPEDALIFDGAGNLYGTEVGGGTADEGTVFEVTP
ncbi:MAG: choice-of-anchor tandem repeat GloVer-containing protein, partial [Candidatus Sulfotelmatobacter sp.]